MRSKTPRFSRFVYKEVELFIYRDTTRKPVKLRLYDALSGWTLVSEMTQAEADQLGMLEFIPGKNRRELLRLLEKRFTVFGREGESLKDMLARLRDECPAGEAQEAIRITYLKAIKRSTTG